MENLLSISNEKTIWVSKIENIRYLTGFTGSTAQCIIKDGIINLITDGRYKTQSSLEAKDGVKITIVDDKLSYMQTVETFFEGISTLVIEGDVVNAATYKSLTDKYDFKIELSSGLIEGLRISKSEEEIDNIKKAVEITDKVFSYVVNNIKVGMTELEVRDMINSKHFEFGGEGASFDPIVASGANAAKPHAQPSSKVIEDGDILTLDFGCYYNGYASDMTRTFFVGTALNEELIKIHNIVLEAHEAQIAAVKTGVKASEIDKIGRDIISGYGYGENFMHSTGHGVGLEVHEAPNISAKSEAVLEENMIITIEPGIYVEGLGGVRIENDIIVKDENSISLNASCKSYDLNILRNS